MIIQDMERNINIAINKMPETTRNVFLMSREQGLKQKEIAQATGLSLYNVNKHLKLAMTTLKQQLNMI
mgnify:CR=1 FL=1